MRAWKSRTVVGSAVLALGAGAIVSAGTGLAHADTHVITPSPDSGYFFPTFFQSLGDLVVDGVHQRVIASDPTSGVIASTSYTGTDGKSVSGVAGVQGLALSADSGTLYAAVPAAHAVVAYSTSTLTETARFNLGSDVSPREVAVAGGRIWFAYLAGAGGSFGSIDPATSAVALHKWPTLSNFYGAPHITAGGNRIAISSNAASSPGGYIGVFDVTSGTEQQVALTSVDALSNIRGLAMTADGSEILAASATSVLRLSSTDLSQVSDYNFNLFGDAVAVDAAGRVAVASRTAVGTPDLYTYLNGSTTAYQAFDMPQSDLAGHFGPDEIMDNGVAWQPGGLRLFVVTDNDGIIKFRALDEPTVTIITPKAPHPGSRPFTTTVTKQFKTASGYYYFHKSSNPVFTTTTTITPYAEGKQRLVFEYYSAGKWHAWKSSLLAPNSSGKSTYTLSGTHSTGVKYRVHAANGPYRYFIFTK